MKIIIKPFAVWLSIVILIFSSCNKTSTIWLDEMDIRAMNSGWGEARINQSVYRDSLVIGGQFFKRGVGTHAPGTYLINLEGKGENFSAKVGVDDNAGKSASVVFYIVGDKTTLWESPVMKKGDPTIHCEVNISGIDKLGLLVTDGGDGNRDDAANWVDASLTYSGPRPAPFTPVVEEEFILTPPAPESPVINGPARYGVRPGSPFLFRIPCTGKRPVEFSVEKLPDGLSLDPVSGIITGKISKRGTFKMKIKAKNERGTDSKPFSIVVGDTLALTPPMGWNSWYIHYDRVSDSIMRNAADQMIETGMADYGYEYVNIDDCWMIKADSDDPEIGGDLRNKDGRLRTNRRFPDMKSMTDYIHSKGLKAGTYISPGPTTCAGYAGSYGHEAMDAQTFAEWGFDFLKYDWCSYGRLAQGTTREDYMAPYILMWNELKQPDRDIILNLCQYGMGEVWKWGGQVGHSWRTTGDLGLSAGYGMPGYFYIGRSNAEHWEYARPGAWNDPDYILIGWVGSAFKMGEGQKTRLTPNEQYSYMSMWSLMAAPLIFSGDMGKLDPFTLNILCNSEVIEVNQDPLGHQGRIIRDTGNEFIMVKELVDGSRAVGLFHTTTDLDDPADYFDWGERSPVNLSITTTELGLGESVEIRDIWRHKDLGTFSEVFETEVPYHGVVFIRVWGTK